MLTRNEWAAAGGALLFGLHPVQVEPVAWATGMKDLLGAHFSLLCLWQYLRYALRDREDPTAPNRLPYALATLCFALALLSKPSAVTVPLIAGLLDWGFIGRPRGQVLRSLGVWLLVAVPFAIVAGRAESTAGVRFLMPLWSRPLIAGDTLAFYLYKLFWPVHLAADYGRSPDVVLSHLLGYLTWLAPAAGGLLAWKLRHTHRPASVAAGIFSLALLPVSGLQPFVFQVYSTVADRYLYLAMLGPAVAVGVLLTRCRTRAGAAAYALILLALGAHSLAQTRHWRDTASLFQHTVAVNPRSWVACNNLGFLYKNAGRLHEAEAEYRKAIAIRADYAEAQNNLGSLLADQGRYDEALPHLWEAARLRPNWADPHVNLGYVLDRQGRAKEAVTELVTAIRIDPNQAVAHFNLGGILALHGKPKEAVEAYRTTLSLTPFHPQAHTNLGSTLSMLGRFKEAEVELREAIRERPDYADAHYNLGAVLCSLGDKQQGRTELREALRLQPGYAPARQALAKLGDRAGS